VVSGGVLGTLRAYCSLLTTDCSNAARRSGASLSPLACEMGIRLSNNLWKWGVHLARVKLITCR
jgi:hypothetical protein